MIGYGVHTYVRGSRGKEKGGGGGGEAPESCKLASQKYCAADLPRTKTRITRTSFLSFVYGHCEGTL